MQIGEKNDQYYEYSDKRKKLLDNWGLTEEDLASKPNTYEVENWLSEDLKRLKNIALSKLSLSDDELIKEPMIIWGPMFWTTYGIPDDEIQVVQVSSGKLIFSCYQFVVVCLSEERIATYSAYFNFLRNVFLNDKIVEYLYHDIVSVSTEEKSTNYNLPNGKIMRRAQIFRLAVPSGDNIEVIINSKEIKDLLGAEPVLTDHEQSVRVIREMLRTKKG